MVNQIRQARRVTTVRGTAVATYTQNLGLMGYEEAQLNMGMAKTTYRTLLDEIACKGQKTYRCEASWEP